MDREIVSDNHKAVHYAIIAAVFLFCTFLVCYFYVSAPVEAAPPINQDLVVTVVP